MRTVKPTGALSTDVIRKLEQALREETDGVCESAEKIARTPSTTQIRLTPPAARPR